MPLSNIYLFNLIIMRHSLSRMIWTINVGQKYLVQDFLQRWLVLFMQLR